jgi:hypothetical protein
MALMAPLLEKVATEADQLMKVSSAIQKYGEQLRSPLDLAKLSGGPGIR